MEKKISQIINGINSKVGKLLVNRLIPGDNVSAVGPFVLLDHIYPAEIESGRGVIPNGEFAQPHRGITTFSYVLTGGLKHFDSKGNYGQITAGGAQWMKAGNGIIQDELPFTNPEDGIFHGVQFWINLPGKNKNEAPEYLSMQSQEIPEIELNDHKGILRILVGTYGCTSSPAQTSTEQFLFHLQLNPKSETALPVNSAMEYAVFVPDRSIKVNGTTLEKSKLATFAGKGDHIILENKDISRADILIFGGIPYTEPIVRQGPFVMNSYPEIAAAYKDFFENKYGNIVYNKE